jgi:hypothetical protein
VRQVERKARARLPGWSVIRRIARVLLGVVLIILGLLALFTPLTPGSWLALVGLEILGLRVLLRDRVCAWAAARPQSRFRRTTCRVLHLDGLDAVKRRWQQRREARSPQASPNVPPTEPQPADVRSTEAPPCAAPPVGAHVRRKPNP